MSHNPLSFAGRIPVVFFKERRAYIAYSPALDLSASGTSVLLARKNFETTLELFLHELVEQGTLERVLSEMGWSKRERRWQPPSDVAKPVSVAFRVPVPA